MKFVRHNVTKCNVNAQRRLRPSCTLVY